MLPKDVPAVRTARMAVEDWLAGMPAQLLDDARSVVTELVANAIRYGEPPIRVTIERQARGVRIDVSDAGAGRPSFNPRGPGSGWGLRIVDALAVAWNIADNASRVWCVLECGARDSDDRGPASTQRLPFASGVRPTTAGRSGFREVQTASRARPGRIGFPGIDAGRADGSGKGAAHGAGSSSTPRKKRAMEVLGVPRFQLEVRPDRSRVVLCVSGELDMATVPQLEQAVLELRDLGWDTIALDLGAVAFIDLTGLRALLSLYDDTARSDRRELTIARSCPALERLLILTKLEQALPRGCTSALPRGSRPEAAERAGTPR